MPRLHGAGSLGTDPHEEDQLPMPTGDHSIVVVANRLPVDITVGPDGSVDWTRSPGGLVTALAPVMRRHDGAWIGWAGSPDLSLEPFAADGIHVWPVPLSEREVTDYYEGFSNGTLWPLYHDVIVPPEYHRHWWNTYVTVNRRFAAAAAEAEIGRASCRERVWIAVRGGEV